MFITVTCNFHMCSMSMCPKYQKKKKRFKLNKNDMYERQKNALDFFSLKETSITIITKPKKS